MKNMILGLALLLPLSTCSVEPAFAQACLTKSAVIQQVLKEVVDSTIAYEDVDTLVFQSPTRPDFLSVEFDGNGCFESYAIVDKSAFELMYIGV